MGVHPDFFEQREAELPEIEEDWPSNPMPAERYLAQLAAIETHDTRGRLGAVHLPGADAGRGAGPDHLPEALAAPARGAAALHLGRGPGRPRVPLGVPDAFNAAVLTFLGGLA